jgi:hypothetical protein
MDDKTFKKSDWIGQGKELATTPPLIRRAAKAYFEIPQQEELGVFIAAPVNLGRSQRKKFGSKCYDDATWEGH